MTISTGDEKLDDNTYQEDNDYEKENEGDEETEMEKTERHTFFDDALGSGQLVLITAAMRKGKSNEASNLMQKAVEKGYDVYTNMLFFEEDEIDEAIEQGLLKQPKNHYIKVPRKIHTVTTASDLILGLYSTRKNFTVLDEAMFFAGSKRGTSKDLRFFEEFVTQIGKLDSPLVLIVQVKSKLAMMLKEDLPSFELKIIKLDSGKRNIEIYHNEPGDMEYKPPVRTLYGAPPSRLPFDTKSPAGFAFNINMEKFIEKVSKLNSLKIRKEIPRIIDELLSENKGKKSGETKTDIISDLIEEYPDASNKEILILLFKRGIKSNLSSIGRVRREKCFSSSI